MKLSHDIAKIAALIGDKARANMLTALMQGSALTAGELAIEANISAQAASNHLNKLTKEGLINCTKTGRHRYYLLASHQVAEILESLGVLANPNSNIATPQQSKIDKEICFARTCYDHLAGKLGVSLTNAMINKNYIIQKDNLFQLTSSGKSFFNNLNINTDILTKKRRLFAKPCLDWTQREHHLAGSLGSALLDYFIENRLIIKSKSKARVVLLTAKGSKWLYDNFKIKL